MNPERAWGGWIVFAGWLLMIIGLIDIFEGLVAIIRKSYYVLGPEQVIVFDVRTWGWITLIWGVVLIAAGLGLLSGQSWARWFAIVVGSLALIEQLGFVGSAQYPLWALTVMILTGFVLYALIVRWNE